jgi:AhpD family alkylhydroperoxidase
MREFPIHTPQTAPDLSKPLLAALQRDVGMVPNLAAGMAESPALLDGFLAVRGIYQRAALTGAETQVLSLVAAYENDCAWCVAFHSRMALAEGVAAASVAALREGRAPDDARLGPLSEFARAMVRRRGAVGGAELRRFLDAGYTRAQALDVVLGMGFSLMANYAGHLVDPPLDAPLEAHAWHPTRAAAAHATH